MGNFLMIIDISTLLNNVDMFLCYVYMSLACMITSLMCTVIILLLLLSNDIELNPGPDKLKSLSVCHVNIRGLSDSKLRAIKTSLCGRLDIITLSETFFGPLSTTDLSLPGYNPIIRRDRPAFGGGIAIYIK